MTVLLNCELDATAYALAFNNAAVKLVTGRVGCGSHRPLGEKEKPPVLSPAAFSSKNNALRWYPRPDSNRHAVTSGGF